MPIYFCTTCGEHLEGHECPRCRAATAIAKPEHAEQAKVTPPAASEGAIHEGDPAFPLPCEEPWPYKHEPGPMLSGCLIYLFFGAILFVAMGWLISLVMQVRDAAERTTTINYLKGIALALHNYHDQFKHLPTPTLVDGQGGNAREVPLSWRCSLVPHFGDPLFNEFDRTVGWDHPKNTPLQGRMPPYFKCPYHEPTDSRQTRFQYFVGAGTMFPANAPIAFGDIKDGTANTFLFAEADQAVIWSRPADMAIRPDQPLPLPADRFLAAMADGTVRMVDRSRTSDATLRLVINPNDGQRLGADWD